MGAPSGGGRGTSTKPMSVEQIVQEAQNFDYNPLIPLKYWLRSATTLLKEVRLRSLAAPFALISF
jgi:STAM-binding protein